MTRTAAAGITAFALAYPLAGALHLPVLVYDPVTGIATVSRTIVAMQMRYFGDVLYAVVAGLGVAACCHRVPPPASVAVPWTAFSLVALEALYYLWRLLAC